MKFERKELKIFEWTEGNLTLGENVDYKSSIST